MSITKSLIVGIAVLVVVVGGALWARNRPPSDIQPYGTVSPQVSVAAVPSMSAVPNTKNNMHEITLTTNFGDIVFQTYDGDAPKTVENFITLASKGFYSNVIFHRVIANFMIQGGDPTGTGSGGPGYQFADELKANTESARLGYVKGTVAMANAGPNTNGSQFFIIHKDYPLPHQYTIFGHVVRGQDVVDKIAVSKTDANDKPVSPVTISKVAVREL